MKQNKRTSFVLYEDWVDLMTPLSDEEFGRVIRALSKYARDGEAVDIASFTPLQQMALGYILPRVAENMQKYRDVCKRREEYAKLSHSKDKDAKGSLCNQKAALAAEDKDDNDDKDEFSKENTPSIIPPRGDGETKEVKPKRFSKPTVEEIQKYIDEKHYAFTAEAFFNHYESVDWKIGKSPMKNWKAACRTWNEKRKAEQMQSQEQGKDDYDHFLDFCQQHYPNLLASFKSVGSHSFYEVRRLSGNNGRVTDRILTAMNNENFNGDLLAEFERRMRNGEA